ncbi:MAG: putative secreted protein [Polyangiaceae bacterium]|jgi:hypothetical protein|nr:putative secreted protein [Polyangiaceae bacterium]
MPKAVQLPPRKTLALALGLVGPLLAGPACQNRSPRGTTGTQAAPSASVAASGHRPTTEPVARETRPIPAGTLRAGSTPGDAGRVPELEAKNQEVELGPFGMDRLPYPNDPAQPPLLGKSRDEARRLCAERGARLCTEVEWERACKGPKQDPYPSGLIWDPSCTAGARACATGFDVLGLGTVAGEWVAGELTIDDKRRAMVRGAGKNAAPTEHRCAARHPTDSATQSDDIGFRCCTGAPNAAVVAEPKAGPVFTKTKLTAEQLEQALAADPAGKLLARDIKFFREDGANTVLARGSGEKKGFDFTVSPLLWNPTAGAEILLVAARSGESTSFVAAFHVLPGGQYRLASSFVLQNEPGPVAFAYSPDIKPRVHFTTCWGCPGETGKALFRKPETVVIVQP